MNDNDFRLFSTQELLGRFFFIPKYQRGYRWETQQVLDLLNDIDEIDINDPAVKYYLQTLVVANRESDCFVARKGKTDEHDGVLWYMVPTKESLDCNVSFEVVDGQQRLTTVFIVLKYLGMESPYDITYETRGESRLFLQNIGKTVGENEANVDFFHMSQCYITVKKWFEDKDDEARRLYLMKLLTKVYFIWYVDNSGKPVETFTRLNIGKIALTNAELIKAMLLKRSNFEEASSNEEFRLLQLEMAAQWDEMEYTLQNNDFWYFINPQEWKKPTRLDFVFELLKDMNLLNFEGKNLGKDKYTTFRYFYQYLKASNGSCKVLWEQVRNIFQIFREWFNEAMFYHYIGFLTSLNFDVKTLLRDWMAKDKTEFTAALKDYVKSKISSTRNLTCAYTQKRTCLPLLLLFNVQTAINQNQGYQTRNGNGSFYKFPFQLYHTEHWDIEHIDSATENELKDLKSQQTWLQMAYLGLKDRLESSMIEKIRKFLAGNGGYEAVNFEELYAEIAEKNPNPVQNKDTIGNYVLLDASTNRGYGNAIYPAKRMKLIGKEQGKTYAVNQELSIALQDGGKPFIPPCTRNVFMKYYTPNSTDIMNWTQADAEAYTKQIYECLKEFGVEEPKFN